MHIRSSASDLPHYFDTLLDFFGPQHWWPGTTRWEIIIGAILTQNTNWSNVEKALNNLRSNSLLTYDAMRALPLTRLEELITPSGFYRVKAQRLQHFFQFIKNELHDDPDTLADMPLTVAREKLLSITGIGPETADSMLLYAYHKPIFVIDAYTKRIVQRHKISNANKYDELQALFMNTCEKSLYVYNEFHALIVATGKRFCKPTPRCEDCPLRRFLAR